MTKLSIEWKGQTFAADFAALPAISQNYLIEYGFRQAISDARAMTKGEVEELGDGADAVKLARMQAKLEKLLTGGIYERANAAKPLSAEEKIRQDVLMAALQKKFAKEGTKLPTRTGKNANPELLDSMLTKAYELNKEKVDAAVARRMAERVELDF